MEEEKQKSKGNDERWRGAISNLTETSSNLDSLQKLLLRKAVFVDEDTFAKASLNSEQARTIKVLEQRVETLERELDASIAVAAHAHSDKRQAELRAEEVTKELENTTKFSNCTWKGCVRSNKIKLVEAIIQTLVEKNHVQHLPYLG